MNAQSSREISLLLILAKQIYVYCCSLWYTKLLFLLTVGKNLGGFTTKRFSKYAAFQTGHGLPCLRQSEHE